MKPAVRSSTVADRAGYQLSPIQPSMRLEEISERARLRALATKLIRMDRLAEIAHQRMLAALDSWGTLA